MTPGANQPWRRPLWECRTLGAAESGLRSVMNDAPSAAVKAFASILSEELQLRRKCSQFEIFLRRYSECICYAIEEREYRDDVYGFGNLLFFPAGIAQHLDILRRGAISRMRYQLRVVEQTALGRR